VSDRAPLLVLSGLLVVLATSCNTPQSICYDMVMALDDLLARCGYPDRIMLRLATGEPATCEDVNSVDDPDQLLNECIPWAQDATCEELDATSDFRDRGCDFSLLMYFPPDS
jgi:hypothetical protein